MSDQHTPEPRTEHHEEHEPQPTKLRIPAALAMILLLAFYGFLLHKGYPQQWTQQANAPHQHTDPHQHTEEDGTATPAGHVHSEKHDGKNYPPLVMVAPFAALLLCIAVLPLIPAAAHFWESNTNKFLVAAGLGVLTLLYYWFGCNFPVEKHWPGHSVVDPLKEGGFAVAEAVFINAIINEFVPFIILLFSLFTITGGIRIGGNLKATPFVNSVILFIGAVLASFIGTTGAAMLLIRLLLETNKERKYKVHTVIMFIFCVCNCGGCLTPLGDPPLFLGYLRGIAFEWTLIALWMQWGFVNLILIGFYFLWDTVWFYRREPAENKQADLNGQTALRISGWMLNVPLLFGVVAAVALLDPGKAVPGTDWHPWYYLREAVQLGLAAVSLLFGGYKIRKENVFNFLAIGEVAALFFGIFICMQAPLQILNAEGQTIVEHAEKSTGIGKQKLFFWSTGALSSVLDNAPTYVVFFETARTLSPKTEAEHEQWKQEEGRDFKPVKIGNTGEEIDWQLLAAVALGAVFMGSMTYIGNGPNFMVKAIAEQSGVKMPSFFGYMVYSFVILLPLLIAMTMLFL
ncbi:MAG: sodium:proton antiporter [Planctomycetaceae bacterium]|jgi:Na+/H+ antiporter NhaD/arsenite permease-like protein|nr:sodium:proton antiporter [Planctomycetaceae bacterium]